MEDEKKMKTDKNKNFVTANKVVTLAIFTTLSLIMFIIENLFDPIPIPGAKMGLSNIFSFAALIMYSPVEAFIIVAIRTILGSLFAGNVSALMYSFTGGIVSMAISSILVYLVYPKISIISISIVAAIAHNMVQCAIFAILSKSVSMLYLLPYLALLGILSGAIVGAVVMLIYKRVPISVFKKAINK
jgi:heptaprenyl diphosphate synthase